MTDYNSLKVSDLKSLLGQRKLLQTGTKQVLIARLQEDDEKKVSEAGSENQDASKEDEISYSDDEATTAKPSANASAPVAATKPQDEPARADKSVAANGSEEQTEPAATAASAQEPFTIGLASTAADEEAKKRADRAKRFGIEDDDDAKKRADRAKRFGLDQKELASGLDSALPERPLKRGRGRADADGNRPGKRQDDRKGRRGNDTRQRGGKEQQGGSILTDAAEKAKAEKRAARFATT